MSNRDELPMMPCFPQEFRALTSHMTFVERSVYRELLEYEWIHGALPRDEKRLAQIVGLSVRTFGKAWVEVHPQFIEGDGGLINERLEDRRREALRLRSQRALGARSANAQRNAQRPSERALSGPPSERSASAERAHVSVSVSESEEVRELASSSLKSQGSFIPERETRMRAGALACERELPQALLQTAGVSDPFSELLDTWKRDVPECNADKYTEWLADLSRRGKNLGARARTLGARFLAAQGDQASQAELIDHCLRNEYRKLIPLAAIRGNAHAKNTHAETLARMRSRAESAQGEDL